MNIRVIIVNTREKGVGEADTYRPTEVERKPCGNSRTVCVSISNTLFFCVNYNYPSIQF